MLKIHNTEVDADALAIYRRQYSFEDWVLLLSEVEDIAGDSKSIERMERFKDLIACEHCGCLPCSCEELGVF